MHTSGLHTVAVTVEELTIKVRLLKLSLEAQLCFSSCSLVFGCGFFLNFILFCLHNALYDFHFPISLIPEIALLELFCVGKSHCVFVVLTLP